MSWRFFPASCLLIETPKGIFCIFIAAEGTEHSERMEPEKSLYQQDADQEKFDCWVKHPYKDWEYLLLDIDHFSKFCEDEQERWSRSVWLRGLPWKILAVPKTVDRGGQPVKTLGSFLQCNFDATDGADWSCVASASFYILNKKTGEDQLIGQIKHHFKQNAINWGYTSIKLLDDLADPNNEFIENDTISLIVKVHAEAPHGVAWDSRKHTGFVGLKNQGATRYLNSILQYFFSTKCLRNAVYQIPSSPRGVLEKSVPLAMQKMFYDLSYSNEPVGTEKLTKSLGWDSLDSFLQHDVQELCRVLLDNLETKMKGTPDEDLISSLFKGKSCSYVKCTDVDYESSILQSYYCIQLNTLSKDPSKHNAKFTIMDAFHDYICPERLDGYNKYDAEQYGLQPAEKGTRLINFPPILNIQLKRFQFDTDLKSMVKVNNRFEFYDMLNLNEFIRDNGDIDYTYYLHAVLVHTGQFAGGHYCVYINADISGQTSHWYKFDDEVVSRVTFTDAVVANFGGNPKEPDRNAYMLVYMRKDQLDEILCDVSYFDVPRRLIDRFEKEKVLEEKNRKKKQDAHFLFLDEETIRAHKGFDVFDVEDLQRPERLRGIEKAAPSGKLFALVHNQLNVDCQCQCNKVQFRLWKFKESSDARLKKGSNYRFRASEQIEYTRDIFKNIRDSFKDDISIIYIERPQFRADGSFGLHDYNDQTHILIFLKYYNPDVKELCMFGTCTAVKSSALIDCQVDILFKMGWARETKLRLYEEIAPESVRLIYTPSPSPSSPNIHHDLSNGVIIIFERIDQTADHENAATCIEKMYNEVEVREKKRRANVQIIHNEERMAFPCDRVERRQAIVAGPVNLLWRVDRLAEFVASELKCNPDHLMLWRVTSKFEKPLSAVSESQMKDDKFQVRDLLSLTGDAVHDPRKNKKYKIFYNKTTIPIRELDNREQMRITMIDEKSNCDEGIIFPDKAGTVQNLLEEAKKIYKFSANGTGKLRLVSASIAAGDKRTEILFGEEELITDIMKASSFLRVEEIPRNVLEMRIL